MREMIERRRKDTVRITQVEGHADEEMVRGEQVRELDRVLNNRADEAPDFGRRGADPGFIDARRNILVCRRWFSCGSGAASLSIAIFRAVVNHDDSARTAVTLRCGLLVPFIKRRRVYNFSRYTALASWADLSLMLSCSSCMSFGLGSGLFLKAAWTSNVSVGCSVWSKQRHLAFLPIYWELDESLVCSSGWYW